MSLNYHQRMKRYSCDMHKTTLISTIDHKRWYQDSVDPLSLSLSETLHIGDAPLSSIIKNCQTMAAKKDVGLKTLSAGFFKIPSLDLNI